MIKKNNIAVVICLILLIPASAQAQYLNVSYNQLMKTLSDGFVMQEIPLASGKKTFRGQTPDGFALLEAMGSERLLEEASVILAVPKDRPEVYKRNSYVIDVFLSNLGLKSEASAWVASAMKNIASAKKLTSEEKIFKDKKIIVQQAPNFGYKITVMAVVLAVKPAQAKPAVLPADKKVLAASPLTVSGIVEGGDPLAIIGGRMYKQGDLVEGLTIQTIGKDFVEFVDPFGQVLRQELGK